MSEPTSNVAGPNIYDLLKQDHKDFEKMFKEIADSGSYDPNIYLQIKEALKMHMTGEEKFFYPKLEDSPETRTLVLAAYEEHDLSRQIMNDIDMSIEDGEESDRMFAKLKVLSETVNIHVKNEEDELFKQAKHVLSHDDEHEIGRLFEHEKLAAPEATA